MTATLDIRTSRKFSHGIIFEEVVAGYNDQRVLSGMRYPQERFSFISWRIKPELVSAVYAVILGAFYCDLKKGNFSEMSLALRTYLGTEDGPLPYGLHMAWKNRTNDTGAEDMPLETLERRDSIEERILHNRHFLDATQLRASTPYADFGWDSFNGAWNPEKGVLQLTSDQSLGLPLANLIAATSPLNIKCHDLKPYTDMLFSF